MATTGDTFYQAPDTRSHSVANSTRNSHKIWVGTSQEDVDQITVVLLLDSTASSLDSLGPALA